MDIMTVSVKYIILAAFCMLLMSAPAGAQGTDRRDVRKGNRDFRKENYKAAEIDYRKALVKDSTSFAAGYNLGNTLYRMEDRQQAGKIYEKLGGVAAASPYASDYYYNVGNVAVSAKDWQAAVEAYRQSLLRNPSDMDAKENYIYAKKMLENQQNQGGGQDQNQDQDKDQNQDNKDGGNDQDRNGNDNKDRGQDNGQDQNQDRNQGEGQGQQGKITPQAAQQILQAIQAKEKETQDKVKKEKAQVLKSRQKEKNW